MINIGIIVNPFSGKDLRRITTDAANVDNHEKVKKVVRMISSMARFGVDKVMLMPDNYDLNSCIASICNDSNKHNLFVKVLDFMPCDQPEDTIKAVNMMIKENISCVIILGGDGTCRLVAKTDISVPIIPVSTGTNNAYPEFWEGTTVGIAAAYVAKYGANENIVQKEKRIEVSINNVFREIALVDAGITNIPYVGSKIVTGLSDLEEIVVCICSPDLIGLSALIGCLKICEEKDDWGFRLKIDTGGHRSLSTINSGQLSEITYSELSQLNLGESYTCFPDYDGTIALDGERTIPFRKGDKIQFMITRNGPWKLDVKKTLYEAVEHGCFKL
jgi:hypothetical protein